MASSKLRDRDAIITREGLIFRVYGYTHPLEGYVCDLEYAPAEVFKSENPKAFRTDGKSIFYKFYGNEGWRFIEGKFPKYMIVHEQLGKKVLGVKKPDIAEIRKPEEKLIELLGKELKDELSMALQRVIETVTACSGLSKTNFGVFGSMLHGFHHPKFSDIDLIVYGRRNTERLRTVLNDLYMDSTSHLQNEFETGESISGKNWRFKNITPQEFIWHQKRKTIYGVFKDENSKRKIKVEFEPVKEWSEIRNENGEVEKVMQCGWVGAILYVKDDGDNLFMPSIYGVETLELLYGPKVEDITRVVSYLEEFRMQAWKDETVYVEGNLEKIETQNGSFHQITLTYGPKYYEQVLKVVK
ncbi:MAG: nucleotidyltransferase domain-containing protein [Candidatus Bathyarchaeia archaeon]